MAVLNPLKVTITTLPENAEEMAEAEQSGKTGRGRPPPPITREVWIERDDFMLDPPKNTSVWPRPHRTPPGATASPARTTSRMRRELSRKSSANTFRHHRFQPSGRNPVSRRHSLGKHQIRGGRRNPHL
ncbi:MAG: hypothetical protein ACLRPT_03275 [Akkermansia muciniphila]